jgi:cell division protein FtsL
MARKRKFSTSEKAFYILSLLIVLSMVIGLFAVALNPG